MNRSVSTVIVDRQSTLCVRPHNQSRTVFLGATLILVLLLAGCSSDAPAGGGGRGCAACHEHADCITQAGSIICVCKTGYSGDGYTCTVDDPCEAGEHNCHPDADCHSPGNGTFTCTCKTGFQGDGLTCSPATASNPCTDNSHTCHPVATCTPDPGQNPPYTCQCPDGYEGDGFQCSDVDECDQGLALCDPNATCHNTDGGYTCSCNEDYEGDGFECSPSDPNAPVEGPCAPGAHTCSPNAHCIPDLDVDPPYGCLCHDGFDGDGFDCIDIDECEENLHQCHLNATCHNTEGGYTCSCNEHYTGDGYQCEPSDDGPICVPACHNTRGSCVDTDDGPQCQCFPGYEGNGVTCNDINECTSDLHDCHALATCHNTTGSYYCVCPPDAPGDGTTCTLHPSCLSLLTASPNLPNGQYRLLVDGQVITVACDMTTDQGGWTQVVHVDASATRASLPQADWVYYHAAWISNRHVWSLPVGFSAGAIRTARFSTLGLNYTQVRARALGYNHRTMDGWCNHHGGIQSDNINSYYVDGISFTYGPAGNRQHLFTFSAGGTGCMARLDAGLSWIGPYYATSAADDPVIEFNRTLPAPTQAELEVRLLADQSCHSTTSCDENIGIQNLTFWVK